MTDASQQVKEWGRHGAPPERDVGAALAAMSEEDLLRLRAIARLRARSLPGGMSWSDLLHEAVLRALTGARPWPPGVPLLAFLAGVMRSLCDEQWRRHRRQDDLSAPHDSGGADDPERGLRGSGGARRYSTAVRVRRGSIEGDHRTHQRHGSGGYPSSLRYDCRGI
jgi:DNA-directed RNA polymerase specialized sigma24 family protein